MDYLITMSGDAPDPIHSGDTKSWFFYYKWRPGDEDEVFFPIGEDEFPDIKAGDTVWFVMDGLLVGKVRLLRVDVDEFNDKKELWFDCRDCKEPVNKDVRVSLGTGPLSAAAVANLEFDMEGA